MSKLRSISIVSSGLLLAMLAVSCNPNASLPAGNNKNSKTPPGPSTEELTRKIKELAASSQEEQKQRDQLVATLQREVQESEERLEEWFNNHTVAQKSSADEAGKVYQKLEEQVAEVARLGNQLKELNNQIEAADIERSKELVTRSQKALEEQKQRDRLAAALQREVQESEERLEEWFNNHTVAQKSSADEAGKVYQKLEEQVAEVARLGNQLKELNNQIEAADTERIEEPAASSRVDRLTQQPKNAHLGTIEKKLETIDLDVQELVEQESLTDQYKERFERRRQELKELQRELRKQMRYQPEKLNRMSKIQTKITELIGRISGKLINRRREGSWRR